MSLFSEWADENLHNGGELELSSLHQAFAATLNTVQRREWNRGRLEQELAGRVVLRGTGSRAKKFVLGWQFSAPDATKQHREIVEKFHSLSVGRFYSTWTNEGELWVYQRPDYSESDYFRPFDEIAKRLGYPRKAIVAAFAAIAKRMAEVFQDEGEEFHEETESVHNQYVRPMRANGLQGFRWRRDGDQDTYFGSFTPPEGEPSRQTWV